MVKAGTDLVVYDARTGEDITRSVLTQIIFEQENRGQNLLPIGFLRQLIGFYDDSLRGLVPSYLEMSMETFARNQEAVRKYFEDSFGAVFPFNQIQQMGKQNMTLIKQAMAMFAPFAVQGGDSNGAADQGAGAASRGEEIRALKQQLDTLQRQLDSLVKRAETGPEPSPKK
jgi:polyhydroxyalkanoate synthesis repressor PhaR